MIFKRDVWNGELYAADPEKLSRASAEASWGDRWEPRAAEAHILSPLALFSKWQSKLNNSRIVKKNNNNFLVLSPDLLPTENWIQSNPEWYIYRKFPLHFQSWTFHVGVKGGDRKGGSEYWSSDRTFVSTSAGSQAHMSCHRRWRKIKMPIPRLRPGRVVCYEILLLLPGPGQSGGPEFGQNLWSYIFQNATVNLKETQQAEKNPQHFDQFSYNVRGWSWQVLSFIAPGSHQTIFL